MIKRLALPSFVFALLFALQILVSPAVQAVSDLADGTYSIDYVITKAENESASMANDYFEKPAVLTVKGGEITAQVQVNHSKWITIFKTAAGTDFPDAKVIKTDKEEDTRVVQFKIEDLSKPLLSKIHVTVPDIDYDHDYTIRFLFDQKTLKNTGKAKAAEPAKNEPAAAGSTKNTDPAKSTASQAAGSSKAVPGKTGANSSEQAPAAGGKSAEAGKSGQGATATVVNPQTGDEAPLAVLTGLLIVSGLFIITQLRGKHRRQGL
ncbi:heme uptake protein IsdC [Paenibacillus filicis]|uniref:Heme uptake protein IsdC n=1 Tax=Paenibacillus filicis TaxID=669464 RepID=A0ABU9DRJ0_9BACL